MPRYIPVLFAAIFFCSCGNNAEQQAMLLQDSIHDADSLHAFVRAAKIERLEHLSDSLIVASFGYTGQENYMHTQSVEILALRQDGFSLLVESPGTIYFVSKIRTGSDYYVPHNKLRFATTKDTVYLTDVYSSVSRSENAENGWDYEEVFFTDKIDRTATGFFQRHGSEDITVSAMLKDEVLVTYNLTANDRKAIADCILLRNIFNELENVYY